MAESLKPEQYKTPHATGCMILRECTEGVVRIRTLSDLEGLATFADYSPYAEEVEALLSAMDKLGIEVYVGSERYFPVRHRGVYHTTHNKMFLNLSWIDVPDQTMDVLRHEGWHAAQDIMAGGIENSFIGIIYSEESVPIKYVLQADIAYGGNPRVLPWEREAKWAGDTPWMTAKALEAATKGPLWETYEPTPLTREWLVMKGFIKD